MKHKILLGWSKRFFSSVNKAKIHTELIIVDDNSPDGTGKIAENLAKKV